MIADLLGLLLCTVLIYPLVLVLLAIRLNRYHSQVDHYSRRLAGLALESSFRVALVTIMLGGVLFIPWLVFLSFFDVSSNILVLLVPPIVVSFLLSLGWVVQSANGGYFGFPKETFNVSNETPNNSFNRTRN